MNRIARAALEIFRLALARDTLGEPPPAARPAPRRPHAVLHVLFVSTEPLGEEPPAPPRSSRPLLRWIFGAEELPLDPEPASPPRRGRLAALFAREKLDDSP